MSDAIIVALIGLAGSGLGSLIGIFASQKLTGYRLEQLEKKVGEHNKVVERTYKLEQEVAVLDEKIKVANNRLVDLERSDGQ